MDNFIYVRSARDLFELGDRNSLIVAGAAASPPPKIRLIAVVGEDNYVNENTFQLATTHTNPYDRVSILTQDSAGVSGMILELRVEMRRIRGRVAG